MRIVTDLTALSAPLRPRKGKTAPRLDLDFRAGALSSLVTFSRAGAASYIDQAGQRQLAAAGVARFDHAAGVRRGLLIEGARTNVLLNSATLATQSVAVTAQSYALAFEGAGSITRSGAHSAVLTSTGARVVLIFTPAAGSLTLTVSGTVQAAQLEAGNCATSYIATTGSAASRAYDELVLPLGPWWNEAEGTLLIEWADLNQQSGNTRIIAMTGAQTMLNFGNPSGVNNSVILQAWNGSTALAITAGADITKGIRRGALAWSASGRSIAAAGLVGSNAGPLFTGAAPSQLWLGSQASGVLPANGCLRRLRFWPRRMTDAELVGMTS